jgi:hypothetical protein
MTGFHDQEGFPPPGASLLAVGGGIRDQEAARIADLRSGEAHAGRRVHGLRHVRGPTLELRPELVVTKGTSPLGEDRVGDGQDRKDGHALLAGEGLTR